MSKDCDVHGKHMFCTWPRMTFGGHPVKQCECWCKNCACDPQVANGIASVITCDWCKENGEPWTK
jgi:hypothetical protein